MKESKTYYKAVFREEMIKDINKKPKLFNAGDVFINRMSEKNMQSFISNKTNAKIVYDTYVSFPTELFDIYKVTETITYTEEKIKI